MRVVPPPEEPASSAWVAIAQAIIGVFFFSLSDTMSKFLRESLPAVEIAWLRYVIFLVFGVVFMARRRFAGAWPKRPGLQVVRAVALLGSAVLFMVGLGELQMAEASALSFISPAFITALSVLLLRESVDLRRWAATLVGLAGVLIIIRPGSSAVQMAALYPLGSALCWAVTIIVTRQMGTQERGETTLLWSAGVGLALLTLLLPFQFVTPSIDQIGIGIALGIAASTGQFLIILAYRRAAASLLSPFSYLQLLTSGAMGYLVFGAIPDSIALFGAAVIIASGLYTIQRERVRAREPQAAPKIRSRAARAKE